MLLYARSYTLAFRSKSDKAPLPGRRIRTARQFATDEETPRFVLDPVYERQLVEFWNALESVWKQGSWTVYLDELFYLSDLRKGDYKLSARIDRMLTQGRSAGITVVSGMQRPARVSRFAMSESTHLIAFRADGRDVKQTLQDAGSREWAEAVESLGRYEFAWYYRPEHAVWRGRVQDLLPAKSQ